MNFIVRFLIGAVFFIVGVVFAGSQYFQDYPLFNIQYLSYVLIPVPAALAGYFLIPKYFLVAKNWLESLIARTVQNLIGDFWNQYTKKLEETRKQRKKEQKHKRKAQTKDKVKDGILLDTSVLIDGRILKVAQTGFITSPLVIPKFVINELHLLADNSDDLKRKKGRRGLELISDLKKATKVVVMSANVGNVKDAADVDRKLVQAAKDYKLKLMTQDYNLNKVAGARGVEVLNLNDLSEAIKPEFIPGDRLQVKIIQPGKEKQQGVGYLADGTMLVVADAAAKIDETVEVEVVKLLQTEAGKMVFCKLVTS